VRRRRRRGLERRCERQGDGAGQEVQPALAAGIDRIAEHRAAEAHAMDPDLVRAAGLGMQLQPGKPCMAS